MENVYKYSFSGVLHPVKKFCLIKVLNRLNGA